MKLTSGTQAGSPRTAFVAATTREAIADPTLRNGAFLAARYLLGTLVSLGNMLVMTWWIGPHAYGVFVTAITMTAFLATLSRAGLDTYLVRSEFEPGSNPWKTASTIITGISTGLVFLGLVTIPALVRWYGTREFVGPYVVLLASIPLVGLTGVPMAKLERELNFGRAAGIELTGQMLSLATAVALAWLGFGIWAPVAGQLVWQVFVLGAASVTSKTMPGFAWDLSQARAMLRYGLGLTASLRAWQLRTLVNPLLVGRIAGVEAVAYVAFAIRVAEGLGTLRLAAGRISLAALSRVQDNQELFRGSLQRALRLQVLTLGPLLVLFALCGRWIIARWIGVRWLPSMQIYPFVAAGVLVNSIYNLQASALFVLGRPWTVLRAYLAHVAILGGGTAFLVPLVGISGYGWAELAACLGYGFIHAPLSQVLPISYRRLAAHAMAYSALLFVPLAYNSWGRIRP
jgi:PST family polysaccharide transporter